MATLMSKDGDKRFAFPTKSFHGALIALVLSLAIFRFAIQDSGDRFHCRALLNEGRWLDDQHTSWQPNGCMLHPYSPKQVGQCLEGRHVVFVGDSTVRQVFYATVKHVDKNVDTVAEKHSDRTLTAGGIQFTFLWDPFLNGTRTAQLLDGTFGSKTGSGTPTLAVLGSGIWYLRHPNSGGINTWDRRIDNLFAAVQPDYPPIADQVILLPVENAIESRLSPERAATVHNEDIAKMNALLDEKLSERAHGSNALVPSLAVPRSLNKIVDGLEGETLDGLHFSDQISKVQASILLNLRCNDVLPKKYPFDKTCCFQYPSPNWVQVVLLVILVSWAPLGLYFYSRGDTNPAVFRFFPEQKYLLSLAIFGFSVAFIFVTDRTNLFLKENKQYDPTTFAIMLLISLAAGLATMKPIEKDLGFLNRDQTDEWKGWMQIAILWYHVVGASKISGIYNVMRVLVAAYLWLSGYGHLSFFLKKADFGFARVANIMIRINLLTVVLSYVMNTDYLSYYFSPLITIWFGIIWITLYIGHKHNDKPAFLLTKMAVVAALTAVFFGLEGPLEKTFELINTVFGTPWNAKEWRFRQTLDIWVVWVGMLTAYAYIKIMEYKIPDDPRWPVWRKWAIISSAVVMAGYFAFELTQDKFSYNHYQPYVSSLPVLAFIVLRNATPALRSTSSKFFAFFGQCSLETFLIQYHMWIAGDTRGVLMMIPGGLWIRPLNLVVTALVFVFVSNQVSIATGALTGWICYVPKAPSANSRLPTSGRDLPADPPSATLASSGAAGGGAEYIALSTAEDKSGAGAHGRTGSLAQGLAGIEARGRGGVGAKIGKVLKTDLRVRFAVIFVGLWALNLVYPSA
ncbi:hypothetical protein JCM8547_001695 [Rhodosporidiobolus lusitaniae]